MKYIRTLEQQQYEKEITRSDFYYFITLFNNN
jgi:hypothetical protein